MTKLWALYSPVAYIVQWWSISTDDSGGILEATEMLLMRKAGECDVVLQAESNIEVRGIKIDRDWRCVVSGPFKVRKPE